MSNQHTRRKFTSTLTFKMLCGLVVLVLLGLVYNFIVAEDDTPLTDEAQEEELQRNADRDTIDIVGDYLWPKAKLSRQDMMTDEQKAAEADKGKAAKADEEKPAGGSLQDDHSEAPVPAPAPALDAVPSSDPPARQTAPAIEKMGAPKIEKIE